jgi:hypothetical protein
VTGESGTRDSSGAARNAALVLAAVAVVGLLALFASYLLHKERPVAGTPAPRALFTATHFTIPARGSACMSSLTLPPSGRILALELGEAVSEARGSPPLEVLLTAPGYRAVAHVPGEQAEGEVQVPVRPPPRYLIGSACLMNRGSTPAALLGSTEPRSASRVKLVVNGKPTDGDIALTFFSSRRESRLSRLGQVFGRASNLTDHLIPVWLVWTLAITVLLAIPTATVAMFRRAVREDEAPRASS